MIASDFSNAAIVYDGHHRSTEDTGIDVFMFDPDKMRIFFQARWLFQSNGHDFVAEIGNFGVDDKFLAIPGWKRKFKAHQIEDAKRRIEQFFLGDEAKAFLPFTLRGANIVGVQFSDDWAAVEVR